MSDTITRKVEKAFDAYLTTFETAGSVFQWTDPSTGTLAYVPIVQGRTNDAKATPVIVMAAQDEAERDDLPQGTRIHDVRLDVSLMWQTDEGNVTIMDGMAEKVLLEFGGVASIQASLNKPSGSDTRTVTGFHVYDIYLLDDKSEQTDRHWLHTLGFNVVCQGVDGP